MFLFSVTATEALPNCYKLVITARNQWLTNAVASYVKTRSGRQISTALIAKEKLEFTILLQNFYKLVNYEFTYFSRFALFTDFFFWKLMFDRLLK